METAILEKIGLTKGEIRVYFALLELGPSTTGPLVDASEVSSSKIYLVLDRLMKKGLASYFLQARKKYFEAADPRRIVAYLDEREKELDEQKGEMEKLMPALLKRRELTKEKHQVTVFRGMKGVETAYDDVLRTMKPGEEYYVLSAPQSFPEQFRNFLRGHHRRREQKKIRVKMMISENARPTLGADREKNRFIDIKYLPPSLILPETILVYKDKAFTIVWGREPIVFLLESKEYADSMRMFFNLLWNEETRTYRGMDGLELAYQDVLDELNPNEEYYAISTAIHSPDVYRDFLKNFHKKRQERNLRLKLIYGENLKNSLGRDRESERNTEVRYVPQRMASPQGIIIYHDKVLTIVWSEEPVSFVLKNKEYANSMKMFFDMLWGQDVKTYRGEDGLKALLESVLEVGECRFIGSGGYFYDVLPRGYTEKYLKKAAEKGMVWKTLGMKEFKNHPVHKLPFNEVRYLSESMNPSVIWIWGNKVANVVWAKNPRSFIAAFVTENAETAENYRRYFDLLWEQETKVYRGIDKMMELLDDTLNYGELWFIGSKGYIHDRMPKEYVKKYCEQAVKKGLIWRHLAVQKFRGHPVSKFPFSMTRYLKDPLDSPTVVWIWGDKVANVIWSENPVAFVFENKENAQNYRKYFEMLWENAVD